MVAAHHMLNRCADSFPYHAFSPLPLLPTPNTTLRPSHSRIPITTARRPRRRPAYKVRGVCPYLPPVVPHQYAPDEA
jgi:hypothetical protein